MPTGIQALPSPVNSIIIKPTNFIIGTVVRKSQM